MKVVVAPDSFKGSLSSVGAAEAIARGIRRALPGSEIITIPLADGGEGTVDAWLCAQGGRKEARTVTGPLGEPIEAAYGVIDDFHSTAVIETAAASGLTIVPPAQRNPLKTTTYGTGQLIRYAVAGGAQRLIIGLGGSATNDCGAGALQALGVKFLDKGGDVVPRPITGEMLSLIKGIAPLPDYAAGSRANSGVTLASDVMNPLTGPAGASAVYGPQKGATPEMIDFLDKELARLAEIIRRDLGVDIENSPGAGAAGGLGAALIAYFGAPAQSGIDLLLRASRFDSVAQDADFIITGEGSIDRQTLSGKAVAGIVRRCAGLTARVFAIGGVVDREAASDLGVTAVSAAPAAMSLTEAMDRAAELVESAAFQLMMDAINRS